MANPLARIVMENIAKKSNFKDTPKNSDYGNKRAKSGSSPINLKTLDGVADGIRGYKEDKEDKESNINISKRPSPGISTSNNNLSLKELSLLSRAIEGDIDTISSQNCIDIDESKGKTYKKVGEDNNLSRGRKDTLSLDSLAKNIKNKI